MNDHRTDKHRHTDKKPSGRQAQVAGAVEANPLAVLAGGLALGAIAGSLIPRSKKEKELLAPLGHQLNQRARNAFTAAKEAGNAQLQDLGLNRDAAKAQARSFVDGIGQALSSAGQAAAKSAAASPD